MRFITAAVVLLAITRLPAATLTLPLTVFGQATSPDASTFTVQSSVDPLNTIYDSNTGQEQRAVLEFSLASLPAGATIELAELNFDVATTTTHIVQGQPQFSSILFYGYAGNNAIDDADGNHVSDQLAIERIDQTGPWTVTLDTPLVQSYVAGHAAAIGVMTYNGSTDPLVAIHAIAQAGVDAPTITLTYSLADLPGDANHNGRIDADDFALTDRGFANHLAGWDNGDFNNDNAIDQNDYFLLDQSFAAQGGSFFSSLLAARQVQFGDAYLTLLPEPASLGILVIALPLFRRRR